MSKKERSLVMLKEFRSIDVYWDKATSRIYGEIRSSSSDEKGRKLTVQIVNDGQIQDLTNADLNLYWETQDGENKGLDPFIALDPENGIYELYFRRGMLQHVGKLNAHLRLVDTTGAITSEPFTIFVFEGVDVDAMANEDELSALNKALIEVQNFKQDEAERVSAETERATAEEERVSNENERKTAETTRNTNETTRVSNETDRVNAEDTRNTNETNRVDAESGRVTAETARVTAEEEREQGYPALDGRITAVEQNIDLLSQKVVAGQHTVKTTTAQSYVEFMVNYPDGFNTQNMTVTVSPLTLVGSGLILYQVTPYATQVRLRLRTFDGSTIPVDTDITIQCQFVRIDSGD